MKKKIYISILIFSIIIFSYLILFSKSDYKILERTEIDDQVLTELEINIKPEQKGQVKVNDQITEKIEYDYGTSLELNPQSEPGWKFIGWEGAFADDVSKIDDNYQITMDNDKQLTATFEKKEYDISYDYEGKGKIHIKPEKETYHYGDIIEVKAEPDKGWKLKEWSRDLSGSNDYISFILVNDVHIIGHFEPENYDLTVNIHPENSGKISINDENFTDITQFQYNTEINLTAIPETGWEFSHWKNDSGKKIADNDYYNLTIENDREITGVFRKKEFIINYKKNGQGDVILEPEKNIYQYGDKVKITAKPAGDWGFDFWENDLSGSKKTKELVIKENLSIKANFKEPVYELKPVLQKDDKDTSVEKLQKELIDKNFLSAEYIKLGNFCIQTKLAVKLYQKFYNLEVDGIVGPQTWSTLYNESGEKTTYTVKSGDNLWELAAKWDTTPAEIREVNNLGNPQLIRTNQELKIPGKYKVEPQKIEPIPWPVVNRNFPISNTIIITDIETGLSLRVVRLYGTYHADVEPLTAEDTATLQKIYGGNWSWNRRAVIVHLDDRQIAGSINGYPHGGQRIKNNDFDGHICLHFFDSKLHANETSCSEHQKMVKKAASKNWPLNQY